MCPCGRELTPEERDDCKAAGIGWICNDCLGRWAEATFRGLRYVNGKVVRNVVDDQH